MTHLAIAPDISAQLKRSARRRSIGIKVHQAQVVVSAPAQAHWIDIERFIHEKLSWIKRHVYKQKTELQQQQQAQQHYAQHIDYLGQRLAIQLVPDILGVHHHYDVIQVGAQNLNQAKTLLLQWLTQQAYLYLQPRVALFAQCMQVTPKHLSIGLYRSKWGSCNRRQELQFNALLMMAPVDVIDYIVVHELAHLRHFDHSPAFWQCVGETLPNYLEKRRWLKRDGVRFWAFLDFI